MIPAQFEYEKVKTVDEAIAALSHDDTKYWPVAIALYPP